MCYFNSFLITIKDNMSFRADFIIQLLTGFLYNFANVAIIYKIMMFNRGTIVETTFNSSLNYIILSSAISAAFFFSVPPGEITQKIVTGDIVREILYPYSYLLALLAQCLGRFFTILLTRVVPSVVVLSVIFRSDWDIEWHRALLMFITLLIGYCAYFLFSTLIDLISFWRQETYYFHFMKEGLFLILSGSTIPMWFYPKWLLSIASYTPFKWMIYAPVAFVLNEITTSSMLEIAIMSFGWMMILGLICRYVWKKGVEKVTVFGG